MFDYIQSCQNPQDISYEGYLKNGVVSVVTVVSGREIAIPEKSPVVLPSLPCSLEGDPVVRKEPSIIEADLRRAEEEQLKKEEHFREVAEKHTGANGGEGDSSFPARPESTKPIEEEPAKVDIPGQIRAAAISEYGMAGWVDAKKLSHALKLPLPEIEAWLMAHYVAYQRPGGGIGYRYENGNGEDRDDRDDGVMKGVMIRNRDEISNGKREVERERVECYDRDEKVRELSGKENSENLSISFSLSNPGKSSHQPQNRQQETQKGIITDTRTNHHDYHTKPIDAEKESSHPKCVVCGADLTGHSFLQKDDKFYCPRPGCGYPPKAKGEAA